MQNEAYQKCMKGLLARFVKAAEGHRAMSECHQGLSACMKTIIAQMKVDGVEFGKSDKSDYHQELAQQHSSMADHMDACAGHCKAAGELPADGKGGDGMASGVETNLDGDQSAKIATQILDTLRVEFGKQLVPTAVRGAFLTSDPLPVTLVHRQGGPSLPVPTDAIPTEFQKLFVE